MSDTDIRMNTRGCRVHLFGVVEGKQDLLDPHYVDAMSPFLGKVRSKVSAAHHEKCEVSFVPRTASVAMGVMCRVGLATDLRADVSNFGCGVMILSAFDSVGSTSGLPALGLH